MIWKYDTWTSGSSRFGRLIGAAREGQITAPVDLRYLQKGVPKRGAATADSSRGRVVTFLRGVYESIAETLPDVKDEAFDPDPDSDMAVQLPQQADPDPYAKALSEPNLQFSLKPKKGKGIHTKRLGIWMNPERHPEKGFEKRWLPPGHIRDYYEQFLVTEPEHFAANGKPIAFSSFWRIWYQEFGSVLQFRPTSSHAICSTCVRHKLLIKGFCGHLRARQAQVEHYADHLRSQYNDRLIYWDLRAQSRLRTSCDVLAIVDGMDQAKFQYPRSELFRSKELQGMVRPRAHICGAIVHGRGVLFCVSPADLRKDANSSIELVAHILQLLSREMDLKKVVFHLQSDNTSREVKNNHTIRFLSSLVSHGDL